jgi:hypothetical protein
LLFDDLADLGLSLVAQYGVIEGDLFRTLPLRQQARFRRGERPQSAHELADLRLRADGSQSHEHISRLYPVAVFNQDLAHDPAFQMLHPPAAAFGADDTGSDRRAR